MMNKIGEYQIVERLDGGGNADVYVAKSAAGEDVAIKFLREDYGKGKRAEKRREKKRRRFKIEVETVLRIQDKIEGVLPVFAYGLPDEQTKKYWYAMPIAIPIEEALKKVDNFQDKIKCILELAKTLEKLHKNEIVHRDIKPNNIYLYKDKFCFGDFGLVDYPKKRELTSIQEPVGPKSTMAPEMRYNAKGADGKKADVYSLAKTLWIVLTGIKHGFEGRYEEDDAIIGLRSNHNYRGKHLVEIEILLKQAIEYDPMLRPSIREFAERLEQWIEVDNSIQKRNHSEWRYLQNRLFPKSVPSHAEWRDIDSMIKILNDIGSMPGLNHMFIPTKGGQDIESAGYAKEEGCLCLIAGGCNYIFKPSRLELENFGKNDYRWSYFRIELVPIEPVTDSTYMGCRESLIEDFPGHYVLSKLINYGRYDDGTKFPQDYRQVDRFLSGSFVIFSKQSIYNHISGTYDARHNSMGSVEFKHYIDKMRKDYYTLKDFKEFSDRYQKNPFSVEDKKEEEETQRRIEESCQFDEFVEANWMNWCLKDICDKYDNPKDGKLEFVIMFHINGRGFSTRKYVSETGFICEEDKMPYPIDKEGKYVFSDFDGAVNAAIDMKKKIKQLCADSGIVWQQMGIYFTIELFRKKPPMHLFMEEEIRAVLRTGNDFRSNRLVIDEDGYAKLIDGDSHFERCQYPVYQESYNAQNNYVGQYANLDDVNEIYLAMLDGWLHHLRTGRQHDVDYYEDNLDAEELIEEIKEYYS